MAVLGVDGWRGAWVGALLEGRAVRLLALADVTAVLAVPGVEVVAIDMPIGLSDDGVRACDVAARRLLGPAGGSVFPTPVRAVLGTDDYAEARALSRTATDPPRAPSAQAFRLVRAIRALDPAVRDRKGTARGTVQRLRALRRVMDVEEALAEAPAGLPVVDGGAECVGDGRTDARGRPMRICW